MKRPVVFIVGAAAGALLVAGVGASAHNGIFLATGITQHSTSLDDEATGARQESPEPAESPEAQPTAEPTEKPEPTEAPEVDNDNDQDENDNEDNNDNEQHTGSGDHESGGGGSD
jgi:hypothetical protein